MKLRVAIDFAWAHRGVEVERFTKGQEIETSDSDLISVAQAEGWVETDEAKAAAPASNKARKAAPENK